MLCPLESLQVNGYNVTPSDAALGNEFGLAIPNQVVNHRNCRFIHLIQLLMLRELNLAKADTL